MMRSTSSHCCLRDDNSILVNIIYRSSMYRYVYDLLHN